MKVYNVRIYNFAPSLIIRGYEDSVQKMYIIYDKNKDKELYIPSVELIDYLSSSLSSDGIQLYTFPIAEMSFYVSNEWEGDKTIKNLTVTPLDKCELLQFNRRVTWYDISGILHEDKCYHYEYDQSGKRVWVLLDFFYGDITLITLEDEQIS